MERELEAIVNEVLSKLKGSYEESVRNLESEANKLLSKYEERISELRSLIVRAFTG
jgi:hypothetical protein